MAKEIRCGLVSSPMEMGKMRNKGGRREGGKERVRDGEGERETGG